MTHHAIQYKANEPSNLWKSLASAFRKLSPLYQLKNPVMFCVYVGSILATLICIRDIAGKNGGGEVWFSLSISIWLWITVLFANFAESIAEGRGKAQADHLRNSRRDVKAKRVVDMNDLQNYAEVASHDLRIGHLVLVESGDAVPGDGQVIKGVASVDESAITGESAPVIRESGGDRDSVTAGTRLVSDWLVIRITANPGEMFIDKMIGLVEGAKRQRTPNEIALSILLSAMTIIFVIVCMSLWPFSDYAVQQSGSGSTISITVLVALFVCLAPTTIGGLISAIGIAGMNRLLKANVIAMSGRAVEASGDVNVLLLDKTGTITHGNRQAVAFIAADGVDAVELAKAAELSSLADETPEGKSILIHAYSRYKLQPTLREALHGEFVPFTAETRMSGVDVKGRRIMKGAGDAIEAYVTSLQGHMPGSVKTSVEQIARTGGTPLLVADGNKVLGVVHLKDVVKTGIKERLNALRRMGIKSIMITGDNPMTAAAIASEAGVDDFMAEAKPQDKLNLIREKQKGGEMVAMVGDGTNDAPALAQSDVAVCMNSGTQAAKEASNMIDLDSDPTKLIEIVEIGKQLLMTRGALTVFSIANDIAKYFAIIPAAFASTNPALLQFNIMGLASPKSAILSAVIFNALIIVCLIPLSMRGVKYRPDSADQLLARFSMIYGLGGIITPFIGIKVIDWLLSWMGFV